MGSVFPSLGGFLPWPLWQVPRKGVGAPGLEWPLPLRPQLPARRRPRLLLVHQPEPFERELVVGLVEPLREPVPHSCELLHVRQQRPRPPVRPVGPVDAPPVPTAPRPAPALPDAAADDHDGLEPVHAERGSRVLLDEVQEVVPVDQAPTLCYARLPDGVYGRRRPLRAHVTTLSWVDSIMTL